MNIDWKDALGALRDNLPEGEPADAGSSSASTSDESSDKEKKGKLHVVIEKKGRKGKTATIIEGFACDDSTLDEVARSLKQRIGTGGSARGGEILLQGEWKDKASELLRGMGYIVK